MRSVTCMDGLVGVGWIRTYTWSVSALYDCETVLSEWVQYVIF